MESQYNQLLSVSKYVSDFYENVYAPVMQTLPWLEPRKSALQDVAGKVLPNLAFPAFEFSSYKDKNDHDTITKLRTRCEELKAVYQTMQDDIRNILLISGIQEDNWKQLADMTTSWKKLGSYEILPQQIFVAIKRCLLSSNTDTAPMLAGSHLNMSEDVLARLIADKIKVLMSEGESNHDIIHVFGIEGHWLDSHFLDTLRHDMASCNSSAD